ncbi:M15 family metallopeptidase [Streptomyces litchfieldiae]|uniref:D-alanyl-D-alanine dipeptidase n=1 Tax=Streptomyces litchfieldiae TaxID=3075543 RepID=A0ABU2MQB9_9ACTN|nr:M15 family metallopeptidase [Streptomyces sp. DSM 44938]MDT0343822.1 M15 family metallopeptidase [Streptomyces sp. DSM 44938]
MRRSTAALALAALLAGVAGSAAPVAAGPRAPDGFVALAEVAPGIRQDMRYASGDNFTGEVVDGYDEAVCLLTGEAARALRRAHQSLAGRGLGLLVYDCYRPRRAVEHFLRWAAGPEEDDSREEFHPRVPKDRLFDEGYLAARSGHSRGSTVDVTLVRRGSGEPVDMGTEFDFFDPRSHTSSAEVGERPRAARELLRAALTAEGFEPVDTEWWHFTLGGEPFPDTYFDFPVTRESLADRHG